jgi:hypothetical protein
LLKNRPLDPVKDTAEVRPKGAVFDEALSELGPEIQEEPKQRELLAPPETATKPLAVQNGRMLATYVGLHLERDKDSEKLVHLDFSFPLEAAHDGFIPKKVKEAWEWLAFAHNKSIEIGELPAVTVDIFTDPKAKKPELHLTGADFSKAKISIVEETGKGKARLVTRFAFRLLVERNSEVIDFAAWHDSEEFWLKIDSTQKKLGE